MGTKFKYNYLSTNYNVNMYLFLEKKKLSERMKYEELIG